MSRGRGHGQRPRPSARLKPGWGVAGEILPVALEQLAELEQVALASGEGRTAQETLANMQRRIDDRAKVEKLARSGFRGREFETFRAELIAYGYPVIRAWLKIGKIFPSCAAMGRPLFPREYELHRLAESFEERHELTSEVLAEALQLFTTKALQERQWKWEGGASLLTYFIGACRCVFPNVFRRWRKDQDHWRRIACEETSAKLDELDMRALDPRIDDDPGVTVVDREIVRQAFTRMPPVNREIAARIVVNDETFAEVGDEIGMSARAVEGRMYRYRTRRPR